MINDIKNIDELKTEFDLDKLSDEKQLALIEKHLPELEVHEVAKYIPVSSEADEARLEQALIENPEAFLVHITRDYKIVTEVTRHRIARKLVADNVIDLSIKFFFTEDEVKTVLDKEFLGKYMNGQQRAAVVFEIGFKYEQKKAKQRMGNRSSEDEPGKALEKLADKYQTSRSYLEQARTIDIADGKHGTHYLKHVRNGLASFDHIKRLRKCGDSTYIEYMEKWLNNGSVTYDSANINDWSKDLVNPVKLPRVGAYFAAGHNHWKGKDRKEENAKRKAQDAAEHARNALGVDREEVAMPTSHENVETVPLTISSNPKYTEKAKFYFPKATYDDMIKFMQEVAKLIDQFDFAESSYSIQFQGSRSTKCANVYIPNEEPPPAILGTIHEHIREPEAELF